jgi:dihydroorotase
LIKGLRDGTIDAIISNHYPIEEEGKKLEYPYAKFGANGLETCFAALNTYATNLEIEILIDKLTSGPAAILGIEIENLVIGEKANITIFDKAREWVYEKSLSKSDNNPFLGQKLIGKVIETIV